METKWLTQLKGNSKDAYHYMKQVKKEYLGGKTLIDQEEFINKFTEKHSYADIVHLNNELYSHKESYGSFTQSFFRITIPVYGFILAFISILIGAFLTFFGGMSNTMINMKFEEKNINNIKEIMDTFSSLSSTFITYFGAIIILIFVFLLAILLYRHKVNTNILLYLAWLNTIKELKKES